MSNEPIDLSHAPPVTKPFEPQDMRQVGSTDTRPASPKKPDKEAEKPLPSFEPAVLEEDFNLEQEKTPVFMSFPPRKYRCYDKMPALLTVNMQERLTAMAEHFGNKGEKDLTPADANRLMKDFKWLIEVVEIIVHEDSLPELMQRLNRADSPHGTIELDEVLDPIMEVISSYSKREAGKP
jgi:hypothetical protein